MVKYFIYDFCDTNPWLVISNPFFAAKGADFLLFGAFDISRPLGSC